MIGTSLNEQLRAMSTFLSASSGHKFMDRGWWSVDFNGDYRIKAG
jgi:hypothetical protein